MLHRTRMLGIAAVAAWSTAAAPAWAQEISPPTTVRVVAKSAKIMTTTAMASDVIDEVGQGTEMDVLLQDDGWYWVVLPRDGYGTRHGGWVRVKDVDGSTEAEVAAKAAEAEAKRAARDEKKQAEAEKHAAAAAERTATAEQKAAAKEAERALKAEQDAARHAPHTTDASAQRTTQADAKSSDGANDKRLKEKEKELEKARADYEAALKRRSETTAAPAAAPQR